MRIQHNIMAMNAYRNYNTNTSALSKNLEKLSSGYKINRAGDDAAGLAISEKMRAQITGLNAASKNVKDGISLVKTAEGAMQEIQDMLNRMDYLATQSANGTYDDPVDRLNLQKEVDALKTEINRIADSANFNGIKLLDGSLDSSTTAVDNATAAASSVKAIYNEADIDTIKGLMLEQSVSNDPTNATDGVGKATILETDGSGETVPSFKVSLNGISHVLTTDNGAATKLTIAINDGTATKNLEVTEAQIAAVASATTKGTKVTSEELAQAIVGQTANQTVQLDGVTYNVTADGDNLVFTATTNPTTEKNAHFQVTLSSAIVSGNEPATGATFTTKDLTVGTGTGTDHTATVTANINGKDVTFKTADTAAAANVGQWAAAIGNATAEIDGKTVKLSDYFTVTAATNALQFTDKTTGKEGSGNSISGVTFAAGATAGDTAASFADTTITKVDGVDAYKTGTDGYSNFGTQDIKVNVAGTKDELASTTLDLTGLLKDGTKIKLGDNEYVIAVGPDSKYKDVEGAVKVNAGATEAQIASALTDAADNNGTFTVGHETGTAKITIKQKAEVKGTTDMSTMDKFASYIHIFQVDEEATQAAQDAADKALAEAKDKQGEALTLQIGDTSDDFNQMKVSIGDMHVSAMGKGKLNEGTSSEKEITKSVAEVDISDQEGAHEAIDIVKNAINYVSGVRGDLGAIQNRLEHTANNLSVMAENIQDAESTIRDTDIAEEMMSYTKNNILIQSAQAMLAQANAVPQGVLQLLG